MGLEGGEGHGKQAGGGLCPHRGHLCAPQSPITFALLFPGSPGHSSSTSMSPLTALSTGKPMDSHPNYTDTPVSAPRTLSAVGTPLNALGSPYRVIASAMGPPSGALAAPAGINLVAPPSSQVGARPPVGLSSHPVWCHPCRSWSRASTRWVPPVYFLGRLCRRVSCWTFFKGVLRRGSPRELMTPRDGGDGGSEVTPVA